MSDNEWQHIAHIIGGILPKYVAQDGKNAMRAKKITQHKVKKVISIIVNMQSAAALKLHDDAQARH